MWCSVVLHSEQQHKVHLNSVRIGSSLMSLQHMLFIFFLMHEWNGFVAQLFCGNISLGHWFLIPFALHSPLATSRCCAELTLVQTLLFFVPEDMIQDVFLLVQLKWGWSKDVVQAKWSRYLSLLMYLKKKIIAFADWRFPIDVATKWLLQKINPQQGFILGLRWIWRSR